MDALTTKQVAELVGRKYTTVKSALYKKFKNYYVGKKGKDAYWKPEVVDVLRNYYGMTRPVRKINTFDEVVIDSRDRVETIVIEILDMIIPVIVEMVAECFIEVIKRKEVDKNANKETVSRGS